MVFSHFLKLQTDGSMRFIPVETTAHQVLPFAIQKLQAAGYKLVTLAECLGQPAYQSTSAPGTPDVSLSFILCSLTSLLKKPYLPSLPGIAEAIIAEPPFFRVMDISDFWEKLIDR